MAEHEIPNPPLVIGTGEGTGVPLYLISFDKHGDCTAPQTRAGVLAAAASGQFTDLHIYSHGWNNVFDEAVAHYTEFFTEYVPLSRSAGLDPAHYTPLIVGIIWPSTALLARGEEAPKMAGAGGVAPAAAPPAPEIAELMAEMEPNAAAQLATLASRSGPLAGADARALAALLAPVLRAHGGGDDEGTAPSADAASLLRGWSAVPELKAGAKPGAPGSLPLAGEAPRSTLEAGGLLEFLDPREILRKATVFIMKDRAGVVGRGGVAALVRDAVASGLRVHLTGHSYGAKVMLSALARLPAGQRASSLLLLQPAVSAYCFAEQVDAQNGRRGGYRTVLDKLVLPVFTTFSRNDRALGSFYPLALRRGQDFGEIEPGAPSDRYAALGAVGPQGMAPGEAQALPIQDQAQPYAPAPAGVRVRALDGAIGITSHGDVRNRFTEWALANLVRQGAAP
jgi:hypothetical protein